jgi:hypothetical protein
MLSRLFFLDFSFSSPHRRPLFSFCLAESPRRRPSHLLQLCAAALLFSFNLAESPLSTLSLKSLQ